MEPKNRILVVDDDPGHRTMLKTLVTGWGYEVQVADDGNTGVDAVKAESVEMLDECFVADPALRVVSRNFEGREDIGQFARSEVFGGTYELVNLLKADENEVLVHLRFTPRGWSHPEPDALYRFQMEGSRIRNMDLQYK